MKYALRFLREELNRERALAHGFLKDQSNGVRIKPGRIFDMNKRQEEHRILSFELAIKALKKVKQVSVSKPEYYWLKPDDLKRLL